MLSEFCVICWYYSIHHHQTSSLLFIFRLRFLWLYTTNTTYYGYTVSSISKCDFPVSLKYIYTYLLNVPNIDMHSFDIIAHNSHPGDNNVAQGLREINKIIKSCGGWRALDVRIQTTVWPQCFRAIKFKSHKSEISGFERERWRYVVWGVVINLWYSWYIMINDLTCKQSAISSISVYLELKSKV